MPEDSNARSTLYRSAGCVGAALCLLVLLGYVRPASLGADGLKALIVAATVILLWVSGVVHPAATALAAMALLMVMPPGFGCAVALHGFSAPVLYFLIGVLALGSAVASSGLARRVSVSMIALCKGDGFRLMLQSVMLLPLMTVIVPSALTRNAILLSPYKRALEGPVFGRSRNLAKAVSLTLGMLNPIASSMVLTGGVAPAVAASLLGGFTWLRWLALMAVPYAVVIISGFGLIVFLCRLGACDAHPGTTGEVVQGDGDAAPLRSLPGPSDDTVSPEYVPRALREGWENMSPKERRVIGVLCAACILWLTDSIHHWNPAAPALLAAAFVLSPWCGALSWKTFTSEMPWALFVVTGAALSLAHVLEITGAAQWLAGSLAGVILGRSASAHVLASLTVLVSVIVHAAIPSIPACLALLLPIVGGFAQLAGLNPIACGLIALMSVDAVALYPEQTATVLMVYEQHGNLARRDVVKFGLGMLSVVLVVVNFIAIPWWRMLGLRLQ